MIDHCHGASYCEDLECDRWTCRKPHVRQVIAPEEIAFWGALHYWCDVYVMTQSRGVPTPPWFFCWQRHYTAEDSALLDQAVREIVDLVLHRLDRPRSPHHWTDAEPVRMWAERVGLLGAQSHVQRLAYVVMM